MHVCSGIAHVVTSVSPPGRVDAYALRRAGEAVPRLVVEAYGPDDLVAAGEVAVWELNQALAALLSASTQARRLTLRDDGRAHGGHLDVIVRGARADLVATGADGRQVAFAADAGTLTDDLNALVRHYLTLTRRGTGRTIVLPAQDQPSARAALIRPAP